MEVIILDILELNALVNNHTETENRRKTKDKRRKMKDER